MQACDREGVFRAEILDYGLKEMESGSVAVGIHCKLTELWDETTKAWVPWLDYDVEAFGDVWIVKKDGTTNDAAAESLMRHAGWDGSLLAITEATWKPTPCQVTVKKETYKDKTSFRAAFINAFDRTPGGGALSNVDEAKVKDLEARFGSSLRALAGNVSRNKPAATVSRPPAPPKPAAAGSGNVDQIPF